MGHQHSAQQADESCFRACLRDKKVKTFKSPAGPVDFPKHSVDALYPSPESYKTNEESKKLRPLGSRRHLQNSLKDSDTSIQLQKQNQTKPNTQVKGVLFSEQKQTVVQEKVYENQQQVGALGLQSKFSSHRSKTKVLDKAFKTSEGTTHCVSQKEVGSSQEASTKSQQTQGSTRSRKILLNKIQDIKQKYFERELQIEIYQEENDYQQRLDQVAELELQCSQGQGQPLPREITSPKKTLIHNFSRRKLIRNNLKKQNSPQQQNPQPNLQLELQSRNSIRQAQPQQDLKSFKKITAQDRLNGSSKSIDASQDVSLEQRVEFSQYSEQDTLQEIRECDEEDEDYKSKFDRGVLPFKPPLSRNNKQPSEAITEKHSESAKSVKVRGAEPSKCSSVRQIRASASPRSSRAEGDNKILFF